MANFTKTLKKLMFSEVFKYLFFGVVTTVFYMVLRWTIFGLTQQALTSTLIANTLSIIFAFFTNDRFVFNQKPQGWPKRLAKFFTARLSTLVLDAGLSFIFVDSFPGLIGQFVNNNLRTVDLIVSIVSQFLIMATNYVISKFFVFKDKA